jgi:methylenetetrahydrofolate dehydrogenase (NADP+) / methenyltetrahydrofolate cyclohydrolase
LWSGIDVAGKHVVIIGRSDIVGRPLSIMLSQRGTGADATVTLCHSKTPDLAAVARSADILIVAVGQAKFVTADMVRPSWLMLASIARTTAWSATSILTPFVRLLERSLPFRAASVR